MFGSGQGQDAITDIYPPADISETLTDISESNDILSRYPEHGGDAIAVEWACAGTVAGVAKDRVISDHEIKSGESGLEFATFVAHKIKVGVFGRAAA
jgi:hypothetical protein